MLPEHARVPWGPLQDVNSEEALANCCKREPRNTKPRLLLAWSLYRQHPQSKLVQLS